MTKQRRAVGDGSVYPRRRDGAVVGWVAAVELEPAGGRRRQKRVQCPTRVEAAEKLRELQSQVLGGMRIDPSNQTVGELLDRWMEIERRPKTVESYEIAIRLRLRPCLGDMKAQALRAGHVQNMVNGLLKKGHGRRAIGVALGVLSRCLNWAVRMDELPKNVAEHVQAPRVVKRRPYVLNAAEAHALAGAIRGTQLELIVKLGLLRAMRRGEVLALTRADVDLESRTLTISGTLQRTNKVLRRDAPKTEASRRVLYLPELLAKELAAHIAGRGELGPAGYIFVSKTGTPLEPRNVTRAFKSALKRAGLPKTIRFHDLRHSAASLMIAAGVDPKTVQATLGHASSRTTMDLYSWALPETHAAAAELLERTVGW